jgi:FHA domain
MFASPDDLGELPRLRELSLTQRGRATWQHLVHDLSNELRVLRVAHRDLATVRAFVERLAGQLDVLGLRGSPAIEPFEHACDVLLDEPIAYARRRGEWLVRGDLRQRPGAPAWLVAEDGPTRVQIWDVAEHEVMQLGRSLDAGIAWIGRGSVARHHAEIVWRDGEHWLRDLGATNRTYLDGERVEHFPRLRDGARIGIAAFALRFLVDPDAGARARSHALMLVI